MNLATLPSYLTLARLQFRTVYAYRAGAFVGLATAILRIVLLTVVWTAAYAGRTTVDGTSLASLIAFLTLAQLQLLILQPTLIFYLQKRIQDGQIALDLLRPMPFLGQLLAQQAGATAGFAPYLLVAFPLALAIGAVPPPASPMAALAFVAAMLLAWLIASLIGLVMGLVAFWTVEVHGIQVIYTFAAQFLGGALVPLAFFPTWLRAVADWLPFRAVATTPAAIYVGTLATPSDVGTALVVQIGWTVILACGAWAVWQRARRIITVARG